MHQEKTVNSPLIIITPFYGALLALVLLFLAVNVIKLRRAHRVSLLDGGIDSLTSAIRAHGNFTEYVPLCLILMALAELNQSPHWAMHGVGLLLLSGRLLHARALYCGTIRLRVVAMSATFTSLVGAAALAILSVFTG